MIGGSRWLKVPLLKKKILARYRSNFAEESKDSLLNDVIGSFLPFIDSKVTRFTLQFFSFFLLLKFLSAN